MLRRRGKCNRHVRRPMSRVIILRFERSVSCVRIFMVVLVMVRKMGRVRFRHRMIRVGVGECLLIRGSRQERKLDD